MEAIDRKVQIVPALEKALDIMEYMARRGDFVTIKEVVADLGIPLATAYRTVNYLLSRNYLRQNAEIEGEFFLGPQIQQLSDVISRHFDIIAIAKPVMRHLASQCGHTVQLGVLQEYQVVYIEQVLPVKPVNIIAALRTGIPVNVSASGKVLVANLAPEEQARFLENAVLEARTHRSITMTDDFMTELKKVKEQGFALDYEEYARGIGCLAVPVRNIRGQVVAAIGITGHSQDFKDEALERNVRLVLDAGRDISFSISP
jgi:DNA-binding IclR family transcriptional regulator